MLHSTGDSKQSVIQCLRYLKWRQGTPVGVDSVDITFVLGQIGLIGDVEEIPGLREKLKGRQWLRVAKKLQEVLSQVQSWYRTEYDSKDQSLPDIEIIYQATITLLGSLVEYCSNLSIEQRRTKGRANTRRYRHKRQVT